MCPPHSVSPSPQTIILKCNQTSAEHALSHCGPNSATVVGCLNFCFVVSTLKKRAQNERARRRHAPQEDPLRRRRRRAARRAIAAAVVIVDARAREVPFGVRGADSLAQASRCL